MGDCGLFVRAFCQAGSGANSLRAYMSGHGIVFTGSVSPGSNGDFPLKYPKLSRNLGFVLLYFVSLCVVCCSGCGVNLLKVFDWPHQFR